MLRFFLVGISLCGALIAPLFLADFLKPVTHALDDWRTRISLRPEVESRLVIVDVDERSLSEQGPWPWPRETVARLMDTLLSHYQVAGVAVDMVFPEVRVQDELLAQQMRRTQVTGAIVFDLEQRNLPQLTSLLPAAPGLTYAPGAPRVAGMPVMANHAGLMPASAGHITPLFDDDGAVRRLPPLVCQPAECRPILMLAAYTNLIDGVRLQVKRGVGLLAPAWQLNVEGAGGTVVASLPMTADGMVVVPYRHVKQNWTSVAASDVLNRKIDPALFKGVMVLIGGTALGLSDVITTPISPLAAGLEPHAEILSALFDNDFPIVPRWGTLLDAILLLPFAILLVVALQRFTLPLQRAAIFPVWLVLTWCGGGLAALVLLRSSHVLLPLAPLLLFPPLALLLTVLAELHRAGSERAGILGLLSTYLPQQVASRLAGLHRGSRDLHAGVDASRREITVMFADIHGFAGLSENQPPEIVARLMQRVFTEMAEAVVAHGGTIDKFIGDAIMAFWNAPNDDPQHARHALAAATDILTRVAALAPFCQELGVAPIDVGIGIETGQALVGNFGSLHRRTFTALGDPVVLASRLESLTLSQQQRLLIGEACAQALGFDHLQTLGSVQIRGRIHPITLYAPIA